MRTRFKKILRIASAGFYLGVFGWFLFILISRWDGQPPLASGANAPLLITPPPPIDPELDRTNELLAALAKIPPFPTYTVPPPPDGMEWTQSGGTVEPSEALAGEWTPQTRPHLAALIRYLQDPGLETAMEQLEAIEPGVYFVSGWPTAGSFRNAAKILTARARYRHAESEDVEGALDDLELVLRLSTMLADSGESTAWLIASECDRMAWGEAGRMAVEHAMPAEEARRLVAVVRQFATTPQDEWRRAIESRAASYRWTLDTTFTDDGSGNGWLVMSRLDDALDGTPAREPRTGAWNVLSIVFNDRKTMEARINRELERLMRAGSLPFAEAQQTLDVLQTRPTITIADAPTCRITWSSIVNLMLLEVTRLATDQQGALAATALAAYRQENGAYPASLDDLVGDYLQRLPMDWYVSRPLRYERISGDDYQLYSVGANRRDDGGGWNRVSGDARRSADDWAYPRPRRVPSFEPNLKKVGT